MHLESDKSRRDGGIDTIDRPIVYYVDGKIVITFGGAFLSRSRSVEKSILPPERASAVDIPMATCKECCMKHTLFRGHILLPNNLTLLHAPDDFVDDPTAGKTHHRIGILHQDLDMVWTLPKACENRINSQFTGSRDDFDSINQDGSGMYLVDMDLPYNLLDMIASLCFRRLF